MEGKSGTRTCPYYHGRKFRSHERTCPNQPVMDTVNVKWAKSDPTTIRAHEMRAKARITLAIGAAYRNHLLLRQV